ncbi:hypothetical protein pb186bvf_011019 [Paramecium bursaria]
MYQQFAWKTSAGRQHVKTLPNLHLPLKEQNTQRVKTNHSTRTQLSSVTRFSFEPPKSTDNHDILIKNMVMMPKEVINFINLLHYQSEFKTLPDSQMQQLNFELGKAQEQIEKNIITKLLTFKETETFGSNNNVNPYINFRISMWPQFVGYINDSVATAIKLLHGGLPKLTSQMENIYKYLVCLLDLTMQWCSDRNNRYIQDQIFEANKQLETANQEIKTLENRILNMARQHEIELNFEKSRYYQLQYDYDQLLIKAQDLDRLINEDARNIAEGGTYQLNKNIKELDKVLVSLDKQYKYQKDELVTKLTNVAIVTTKKENIVQQLRQYIGINVNHQQAGDQTLGHILGEHPWIPILEQRNITNDYYEEPYNEEEENKVELLHKCLQMDVQNQSMSRQLIQQKIRFRQIYKQIQTLIQAYEDSNQTDVLLQQLCALLFNIHNQEGLEVFQVNELKKTYQNVIKAVIQIQNKVKNGQSLGNIGDDEYTLRRILKLNPNNGRSILLFSIRKDTYEPFFKSDIEIIFETKMEVNVLQVLHWMALEMSKISKQNYSERLSSIIIPENLEELSTTIQNNLFIEYKLNKDLVQQYLISRYCYLKEKQLTLNTECFSNRLRYQEDIFKSSQDNLRKILIFNPQLMTI